MHNKLHWAVTGKTAAEPITERVDAEKPSMGLTTWKNATYLDYAENQAARQIPMKMADWVAKLDASLQCNECEVLANARRVSAEVAKRLAEAQYEKFRVRQDLEFESDFEAEVKRIESKRPRKKKEEP